MNKLTPEQQRTVEEYVSIAERMAAKLCRRINEDIRSQAHLSLCAAVLTHDPSKSSLKTWIYRVLRLDLANSGQKVRAAKRQSGRQRRNLDFNEPGVRDCGQESVDMADLLNVLPEKYREIFELHVNGQTVSHISKVMDTSRTTVFRIIQRCRKRLARELEWTPDSYSPVAKRSTIARKSPPARKGEMGLAGFSPEKTS